MSFTDTTPTLLQVLEALLLLSEEPISLQELEQWMSVPPLSHLVSEQVDLPALLSELSRDYKARSSPLELMEVADGWQFFSRSVFAPYLQMFLQQKEQRRLSKAALEALAIVAYKQPLTRSELEHIRGVNSDYAIQKLLEKELVEPAGRADLPGKPLLYRTTRGFLTYFGLKNIDELPKLKELNHEKEADPEEYQTHPVEFGSSEQPTEHGATTEPDGPPEPQRPEHGTTTEPNR